MVKLILQIIVGIFGWLNNPRRIRKADEADAAKEQATKDSAIETGDADAVNKRIQNILKIAVLTCALSVTCSCTTPTKVVYVPADEKAIPILYEGKAGWFVPNAIMQKLLNKAEGKHDGNHTQAD